MRYDVVTTVIGSYPVEIDNLDLIKNYFEQREVSWNRYIKDAVNDMIKAGVELISDGQTRDTFINIFYRKLGGCRIRNRAEVIDKIHYIEPITIDDQRYVKGIIPGHCKLLGLLAGPYTLSKSCVDLFYKDEKELAFDFAYAIREEAKNLQRYVDCISIDEPFFSISMPEYAKELIEIVLKGINCQTRLHVCGDISKVVPKLLDIPVDVLSHEFKASPELFDIFKEYSFSQKICLGSVRSDSFNIESVEDIVKHITKGKEIFGEKIVQIAPDCGLRTLSREVAFKKLKNLVKAKEIVYGRKESTSNKS